MSTIFIVILAVFSCLRSTKAATETYYWRNVIYENLPLSDDTLIGPYPYHTPETNDVLGIDYHFQSGIFIVAVGRLRPGVPSNLNAFCIGDYVEGSSPHIWGFPNYDKNTLKASFYDESFRIGRKRNKYTSSNYTEVQSASNYFNPLNDYNIISVYHPIVDSQCNRLFILDTGVLRYGPSLTYSVQNPSILVYQLQANSCITRNFPLVRRVEIPNYLWKLAAGFGYITVDYQEKGSCDDVFLYITNAMDATVTVYDYKHGEFWQFADETMKPILTDAHMVFNKDYNYDLILGIMNVVLGYPDKDDNRNAYFAPAASIGEFAVSTKLLKKSKRANKNYNPEDFKLLGYRGCNSQNFRQFFDHTTGVIFFGEMQSNKVRCWNSKLPLNPDNIGIVMESDKIQFISEIFVDSTGVLWFLTNQLPIIFLSDILLDTEQVNSRVFRIKVLDAIKGTVCDIYQYDAKKEDVELVYYWRDVIYEDLPINENTLIGPYPYYIPGSNDVLAIGYHEQSGLMITTVGRIRPGVPSVLNAFCVSNYAKGTSPHIWGFPDYDKNMLKASFYGNSAEDDSRKLVRKKHKYSSGYFNHFYNVYGAERPYNPLEDFSILEIYGVLVDNRCNRLFVLDVGTIRYSDTEIYIVQNPAVIVFDLPSDGCTNRKFRVIRRVEIPQHLWKNALGYTFDILDYQSKDSCDDVFMYSNNIFDNSVLVYDYKHNEFWTFAHPSMNPITAEATLFFAPKDFYWTFFMGIMSITLGRPDKDGNRNAYYAPGASTGEYLVSTKLLKNRKRAPSNFNPKDFKLIAHRGCETQTNRRVFDLRTGVMFFGEMQSKRLTCWNTENPLNPDTLGVVFESDAIPFISDMFIDSNGYLWFLADNLPFMFLSDQLLDTSEINSRLFRVKISDAIKGTVCDITRYSPRRVFFHGK